MNYKDSRKPDDDLQLLVYFRLIGNRMVFLTNFELWYRSCYFLVVHITGKRDQSSLSLKLADIKWQPTVEIINHIVPTGFTIFS